MAIRPYLTTLPKIADAVYIDEAAVVIGDVTIGRDSSFWPGAVARGDVHHIVIGERTNIQDNSVLHVTHQGPLNPAGSPLQIGSDVTAGHRVMLHGCQVHDRVLIGMGTIILDGAVIESDVIIGAGSLVPENKVLASGYLYFGSPVIMKRPLTEEEKERIVYSAAHYVKVKDRYLGQS